MQAVYIREVMERFPRSNICDKICSKSKGMERSSSNSEWKITAYCDDNNDHITMKFDYRAKPAHEYYLTL